MENLNLCFGGLSNEFIEFSLIMRSEIYDAVLKKLFTLCRNYANSL